MSTRQDSSNIARRNGVRYRPVLETPEEVSADVREFKAHTEGISNRMEYPSVEAQRAGTVVCLHTNLRRYLRSAKRLGLTREWAMRLVVWLQRTVDSIWHECNTPTRVLEERAMEAEHHDNVLEKKLDLEKCIEVKRARIETLSAEVVRDVTLLGRYQREVELEAQQ